MDQLFFDFNREYDSRDWPEQDRFPLNIYRMHGSKWVQSVLLEDYRGAEEYLVITGFTSLAYLVFFLGQIEADQFPRVHILFGNEPTAETGTTFSSRVAHFPDEIREYWLKRGISVLLNGPLITFLQRMQEGCVTFSEHRNLHAKIYLSEKHAVLGSSNFSRSGLMLQKEANIRVAASRKRYREIRQIAENFVEQSSDCTEKMKLLLESLLQHVSWKEALARAVAELLEGEWIKRYPFLFSTDERSRLWPSQQEAIAQALYILDNQGSVLLADPTGSGKTRVGINLLYSVINRKWKTQITGLPLAVVIAPPLIQEQCWKQEGDETHRSALTLVSSGILSSKRSPEHRQALEKLKQATILLIDEAHNFLNSRSARSKTIAYNGADHVILSTATPINRRITDLFRLVEILGLDNLSEDIIRLYNAYRYKKRFTAEELSKVRNYVRNFTVRRTKSELNEMIASSPAHYTNRLGNECRYPHHICKTYPTGETEEDKQKAERIDEIASGLRGLLFLRKIGDYFHRGGGRQADDHEKVLERSLTAAKALALYNIRSMLRSSRPALLEHIEGTEAALEFIGLGPNSEHRLRSASLDRSGNVLKTIRENSESLPEVDLETALPPWLQDLDAYRTVCEEEGKRYRDIAALVRQMGDTREQEKARKIGELSEHHPLVLAYDNRVITLFYIRFLLSRLDPSLPLHVVTGGSSRKTKQRISHLFGLDSRDQRAVAFCSDAMAEGVNFQAASAVCRAAFYGQTSLGGQHAHT